MRSTTDFLLDAIPGTVVDAFAEGDTPQVLQFSVMFGFALHKCGGRGTLVFDLIECLLHVLLVIVGTIMKVAASAPSARWASRSASTASARRWRSAR